MFVQVVSQADLAMNVIGAGIGADVVVVVAVVVVVVVNIAEIHIFLVKLQVDLSC